MDVLLFCLFISVLMPILAKAPLAIAMHNKSGYNNRLPRTQQASLAGFGARAKAAHENCFEALLLFAPGVLALVALNQVTAWVANLAIVFVISRVLYVVCYLADWHVARSSFWALGFGVSVYFAWLAIP